MKKRILIIIAFFAFLPFVVNSQEEIEPPPPPPPPPVLPHHRPLLELMTYNNSLCVADLERVVVWSDDIVVNKVSRGQLSFRRNLAGSIDTIRVENRAYHYRQSWGRRYLRRVDKYNSLNLLIEAVIFNSNSTIRYKIFFEYDDKNQLITERWYSFWGEMLGDGSRVQLPDFILVWIRCSEYKNGKLSTWQTIRYIREGCPSDCGNYFFAECILGMRTNSYFDKQGNEIRFEQFYVREDTGEKVFTEFSRVLEFAYDEKNRLTMLYFPEEQEKITIEYAENKIITYRTIGNNPRERHYVFILE